MTASNYIESASIHTNNCTCKSYKTSLVIVHGETNADLELQAIPDADPDRREFRWISATLLSP